MRNPISITLAVIGLVAVSVNPSSAIQDETSPGESTVDTTAPATQDTLAAILERHSILRVTTSDGRLVPVRQGEIGLRSGETSLTARDLALDLNSITLIEHRDRDLAWGAQRGFLVGLFSGLITVGLREMFDMWEQYEPGEEGASTVALTASAGAVWGLLGEAVSPAWKTVYRGDSEEDGN